jgi:hypothetical protein
MKQILFFLILTTVAFAEHITLDNQTSYPNRESQMGIQWANTAKEVSEQNDVYGPDLKLNSLKPLNRSGKTELNSPVDATYFRVVIWKKGEKGPDLMTNWVDIQSKKIYTLKDDQLIPAVLMAGMGC